MQQTCTLHASIGANAMQPAVPALPNACSPLQETGEVHLDDNLRAELSRAPLFVSPASHNDLLMALWEDTAFLSRLDVMDYSLLVRDVQERFRDRDRE